MKTIYTFVLIIFLVAGFNRKADAQANTGSQEQGESYSVAGELKKAQNMLQQGNNEEASKIFVGLMQNEPDNKEAVQGWLIANMKRTPTGEEDAIILLDSLNIIYPENTGVIFFRAFIEAEYGHIEDALNDFETLIKIQPDEALNYIGKGQVLYGIEKFEEAFIALDKATSLDSGRSDVWGMKAAALAKMGHFNDAVTAINKGLELDPDNPATVYNRACIYSLTGDKINAIADLKKAISMNNSFREYARTDEDFKSLYNDEDFKKLTQ